MIDPRLSVPQPPPPPPKGRLLVARAGYAAGVAAMATGIYLLFGVGWTLVLGGLAMAASFLLLFDIDGR